MKINSNGSKWAGEEPDTIEVLIDTLKTYTLDPTFEEYGNFVLPNKGTDQIRVWGNFQNVSHVFSIDGTEAELAILIKAIREHQQTTRYLAARKEYVRGQQEAAKREKQRQIDQKREYNRRHRG
jgi:hypothetical protein